MEKKNWLSSNCDDQAENIKNPWTIGRVCNDTWADWLITVYKNDIVAMIIIIIIWFGDTVTVSHLTKCDTNSKVRAMSA